MNRCLLLSQVPLTFLFCIALEAIAVGEGFLDAYFSTPPNRRPHLVLDAQGFSGNIHRVTLSNDGKWLAGVDEKTVRIWNLETGKMHAALRGYQEPDGFHIGYIDSLTFAPDNQHLVVGVSDNSKYGSTRVYDLKQPGKIKQLIAGHTGCTRGVTFSKSGKWLATWGCDGNIVFYRRRGGNLDWQVEFKVGRRGRFTKNELDLPADFFAFTPDERHLGFRFRSVNVVSVDQRRSLHSLDEVPNSIRRLNQVHGEVRGSFGKWSSSHEISSLNDPRRENDPHIVLAGSGTKVKFFGAAFDQYGNGISVHPHGYRVTAIAWNENCGKVATADALGEIHVWDPITGEGLHPVIRAVTRSIWNVRWSSDSERLLFSDKNYAEGRWSFNRYGGVNEQIDLTSFQITPTDQRDRSEIVDHPIWPKGTHDRLGEIELLVVKTAKKYETKTNHDWTLYAREVDDHARNYILDPWLDASVSSQFRNLRIRIPESKFGEVTCMRFVDSSGGRAGNECLIGTEDGKLIQAKIEVLANGRVALRITKEFMGHTAKVTSFDVSPDRTKLVSSSLDGTIRVWPLRDSRPTGDVDFGTDGTRVSRAPSRSLGYSSGIRKDDVLLRFGDGSFYERIRKIQSGQYKPGDFVPIDLFRGTNGPSSPRTQLRVQVRLAEAPGLVVPLASMMLTRDGERVIWTPDGYYESSSQGAQYVGWHINNARHETAAFYPLDRFQKQYYQPKAIRYAIRNSDTASALDQVADEVVGFEVAPTLSKAPRSEVVKRLPPKIDILSPAPNFISDDSKLTVVSRVRAGGDQKFSQVRYRVDGHAVPGRPKQTSRRTTSEGIEVWYEQSLDLPVGEHTIEMSLNSSNQTRGTQKVTCTIRGANRFEPSQGRLFVLAVGISDYANDELNLNYARPDAQAFAEAWDQLSGSVYSETIAQVLTDDKATSQSIRAQGFSWLLSQSIQPDDTVMVYLAGHGFFDDYDEWYFAGHDVDVDQLISTAISDAELDSFLSKIPTNLIMFTDTCHAGGFVSNSPVRSHPHSGADTWRGRGHVVFASCLAEENSFESPRWEHGAFTKGILEFLRSPKADYNGDQELTFNEMVLFVQTYVRKATGNAQNPTIEMPSSVSNIRFASQK